MSSYNKKHVAPLKIVEHYEAFKKAMSSGNYFLAKKNIEDMKFYQGGEKLAKSLKEELDKIIKQHEKKSQFEIFNTQEPLSIDDIEKEEEERAHKILGHMQSYEAFVKDFYFNEAEKEIYLIQQLGDLKCAKSLEERLEDIKSTHKKDVSLRQENNKNNDDISIKIYRDIINLGQSSIKKAQDYFNENSEKLIECDFKNSIKFLKSQEDFLKKEVLYNFHNALKEGRITYARNLIKNSELQKDVIDHMDNLLNNKIYEIKEEKRKEKVNFFMSDLEGKLLKNDFKEAKKILTKINSFANENEFKEAEKLYEETSSKDRKIIKDNLYNAVKKNIQDLDFDLAEKNIKDYRSIAERKEYLELYDYLMTKKEEYNIRKKISIVSQIKQKQNVYQYFLEAKEELLKGDIQKSLELAKLIEKEGDITLSKLLKKQIELIKYEEQTEKINKYKESWKNEFYASVNNLDKDLCDSLLKDAEKSFSKKELEYFKNETRNISIYKTFYEYLNKKDFIKAQEIIMKSNLTSFEKEQKFLEIIKLEDEYSYSMTYSEIQKIENEIETLKNEGKYDEALKKSKELIDFEKELEFKKKEKNIEEHKIKKDNLVIFNETIKNIQSGHFDVYLRNKNKFSFSERKELLNSYFDILKRLKEEERLKEIDKLKNEMKNVLKESYSLSLQILDEIKLIVTEEEFINIKKEFQIEKEDIILELENKAYHSLEDYDFNNVRVIIKKFIDYNEKNRSEDLFKKCIIFEEKWEKEQIKKILGKKMTEIFDYFKDNKFNEIEALIDDYRFLGEKDKSNELEERLILHKKKFVKTAIDKFISHYQFSQCWDFLDKNRSFLTENEFNNNLSHLITHLEEWIIECMNDEKMDEVNECMKLFKSLSPEHATNLDLIILEKKATILTKQDLTGSETAVKKKAVLKFLQKWYNDYNNGIINDKIVLKIKEYGENDLAEYLENVYNYSHLEKIIDKRLNLILFYNDIEKVEKSIYENFQLCSNFKLLKNVLEYYIKLFNDERNKVYLVYENEVTNKINQYLKNQNIDKARNYLYTLNFTSLRKQKALYLNEKIDSFEKSQKNNENNKNLIKLRDYLEKDLWDQAKKLIIESSEEDFPVFLREYNYAYNKELKEDLNKKWILFKNDIENYIKNDLIDKAWDEAEQINEIIPFELYETERPILLNKLIYSFEVSMQKIQRELNTSININSFDDAKENLSRLENMKKKYNEKERIFLKYESLFQKTLSSIKNFLNNGDIKKAKIFIEASKNSLLENQYEYLNYYLREKDLSHIQYFKDQIDEFNNLINNKEFNKAKDLLISLKDVDTNNYLKLTNHYNISFKKFQKEAESSKINKVMNLLVEKINNNDFKSSEELIRELGHTKEYIEMFYLLDEKKSNYFKESLIKDLSIAKEYIKNSDITKTEKIYISIEKKFINNFLIKGDMSYYNEIIDCYNIINNFFYDPLFNRFKILLDEKRLIEAQKLTQKIKIPRYKEYLLFLIEKEKNLIDKNRINKEINNIKVLIDNDEFEESKKIIKKIYTSASINEIYELFYKLINKEIESSELKRKNLYERIKSEFEFFIKQKNYSKSKISYEKLEKVSLETDLVYFKEKLLLLENETRKIKIDKLSKIVQDNLESYKLDEALTRIKEIEILGDKKLAYNLYKKLEIIYIEVEVNRLLEDKKFEEAEKLLNNI